MGGRSSTSSRLRGHHGWYRVEPDTTALAARAGHRRGRQRHGGLERRGDITPGTVEGLYVDDARVLSTLAVTVGDEPVTAVDRSARGAGAEFFGAARGLGDPGADATVEVRRARRLDGPTMTEEVTVTSRASAPVRAAVRVELAADGLPIVFAKYGVTVGEPARPEPVGQEVRFRTAGHRTTVGFEPAPDSVELGLPPLPPPGGWTWGRGRVPPGACRSAPSAPRPRCSTPMQGVQP